MKILIEFPDGEKKEIVMESVTVLQAIKMLLPQAHLRED